MSEEQEGSPDMMVVSPVMAERLRKFVANAKTVTHCRVCGKPDRGALGYAAVVFEEPDLCMDCKEKGQVIPVNVCYQHR